MQNDGKRLVVGMIATFVITMFVISVAQAAKGWNGGGKPGGGGEDPPTVAACPGTHPSIAYLEVEEGKKNRNVYHIAIGNADGSCGIRVLPNVRSNRGRFAFTRVPSGNDYEYRLYVDQWEYGRKGSRAALGMARITIQTDPDEQVWSIVESLPLSAEIIWRANADKDTFPGAIDAVGNTVVFNYYNRDEEVTYLNIIEDVNLCGAATGEQCSDEVYQVSYHEEGVVLGGSANWPSLSPTLNRIFFLARLDLEGPIEIAYSERDTDTAAWITPPRVMVHRDDYGYTGDERCGHSLFDFDVHVLPEGSSLGAGEYLAFGVEYRGLARCYVTHVLSVDECAVQGGSNYPGCSSPDYEGSRVKWTEFVLPSGSVDLPPNIITNRDTSSPTSFSPATLDWVGQDPDTNQPKEPMSFPPDTGVLVLLIDPLKTPAQ